MKILLPFIVLTSLILSIACTEPNSNTNNTSEVIVNEVKSEKDTLLPVRPAIFNTAAYLPLLQGKNIAMVVNQTSSFGEVHLVDSLLSLNVKIDKIFAPEHGFRGKADAGEVVKDSKDVKTGLPIVSLYGKNKKPSAEQLAEIDVILFDIQDVGVRFYTYISSLHYVMEAAAEQNIQVIILDRPNPHGHYVDGPILKEKFKSFVGMHKVPVVYGLTIGEYGTMINGENWIAKKCDLTVIPNENYTHEISTYEFPIKPSPNLPNMKSIYLYPSLCFFEGTVVSVGRGTDLPFQQVGHPNYTDSSYSFTPKPNEGAKYPKLENKTSYGIHFKDFNTEAENLSQINRLNLSWIIDFYTQLDQGEDFFLKNNFINLLAGTDELKQQILSNTSEESIRSTWKENLEEYKQVRKKYLMYKDFE